MSINTIQNELALDDEESYNNQNDAFGLNDDLGRWLLFLVYSLGLSEDELVDSEKQQEANENVSVHENEETEINHIDQNEVHIENVSESEISRLQTQISDFEKEVRYMWYHIIQICKLKEELELKEKEGKEAILSQNQQFQKEKESILQGLIL